MGNYTIKQCRKKLIEHKERLIEIYKKIPNKGMPQPFLMPLSLRLIKELSSYHIEWRSLHFIDALSIIYSLRIDRALEYLNSEKQRALQSRGISEVRKATEEEFDNL